MGTKIFFIFVYVIQAMTARKEDASYKIKIKYDLENLSS